MATLAQLAPSPHRGEGWGEGGTGPSIRTPSPRPSPLWGEGEETRASLDFAPPSRSLLEGRVAGGAERAVDGLGGQRQRDEPHADGILDRVRDRGRDRKGPAFANALGAERAGCLLAVDRLVEDFGRNVE